MKVVFTERAKKDWRRFDHSTREQLRKKLYFYAKQNDLLAFAEKLRDGALGEYRFRVGDYRVVFDRADGAIFVLRVGHRKDIYR